MMRVHVVSINYERIKQMIMCWVQFQAETSDFYFFLCIRTGFGVKLVSE
jgi:hypothetical protein